MKKIMILVVAFFLGVSGFAQEKDWKTIRKAKAEKFTELAAKEFDLTKDQQKALYERKLQHFKEQEAISKKVKQGKTVSKEQKQKPNKTFGTYFSKLTGKKYDELAPFYKKSYKEMQKIK